MSRHSVLLLVVLCISTVQLNAMVESMKQSCQSICCVFFGLQDASTHYKALAREACVRCKLSEEKFIPIKKMNAVLRRLTNDEIVSFTFGDIWINEYLMDQLSESERIFILQHEVMHYLKNHRSHIISALFGSAAILCITTGLISHCVPRKAHKKTHDGVLLTTALATFVTLHELLFRKMSRLHEQEAEVAAAQLLCSTGNIHILRDHLDYLESLLSKGISSYGAWWPSIPEQIAYLNTCIETYQQQREL